MFDQSYKLLLLLLLLLLLTSRRCLNAMQSPGLFVNPVRSPGRLSHSFMARANTSHPYTHEHAHVTMGTNRRSSSSSKTMWV